VTIRRATRTYPPGIGSVQDRSVHQWP
jgi:hypothetical protein